MFKKGNTLIFLDHQETSSELELRDVGVRFTRDIFNYATWSHAMFSFDFELNKTKLRDLVDHDYTFNSF